MYNIVLTRVKNLNVHNFTSRPGVVFRRAINPIYRRLLKFGTNQKIHLDRYPKLQRGKPYIFVSTHSFSEDIISALHIIDRNAYVLIGTRDQVDHNPQMYAAWINGMIYVDRYQTDKRKDAVDKMERILKSGTSVLIFAEGGYNHKENEPCMKLFNSPYYLAQRTGYEVVPIASFNEHYSKDIYINVGDPIALQGEDKREFRKEIRQELGTLQLENVFRHSSGLVRKELGDEPRFDFMKERMEYVYGKVKWTGTDFIDEELVEFYDPEEPAPAQVRKSLSKVRLTRHNLIIFKPILLEMKQDQKYDFKAYMKKNWTQQQGDNKRKHPCKADVSVCFL